MTAHDAAAPVAEDSTEAASPVAPEPIEERPPTIEEQLQQCVIRVTGRMEHLPPLLAPELASIGRCATLTSETTIGSETDTMMYEGLISFLTADCISLIHCGRFASAEYELYRQRLDPGDERHAAEDDPFHNMSSRSPVHSRRSSETNRRGSHGGGRRPSSSNDPTNTDEEGEGAHPWVAPSEMLPGDAHRLRELVSMGPLPYVTLSRKKIQDVHFALNPPSTFYSLFQNPEKHYFDMQCLRMFVRRYLVHTSQGNNPGGISLKSFVAVRANCPGIDEALLETIAKEEVAVLAKVNNKIESERAARHQRRRGELEMFDMDPLRDLLVSTGVTRLTIAVGVVAGCIAAFAVAFAVLFIYGIGLPRLLFSYVTGYWQFFFVGAFLCIPASIATSYHAGFMTPPMRSQVYFCGARALISGCALAISVWSAVKLISAARPSTFETYYRNGALGEDTCVFFVNFHCSGFNQMDIAFATGVCHLSTLENDYLFTPCRSAIMMKLDTVLYPMIVAYLLLSGILVADFVLLFVLLRYLKNIDEALASPTAGNPL